ncbi:MAG: YwiC-like family protein [Bacteroidota bacterium]
MKNQKDKLTWFRYILPSDPGIWIVFLVPIVSGLAHVKTIDVALILFFITATALLFTQTSLTVAFAKQRECRERRPAGAALIALAILGTAGAVCATILLFVYKLWMLLPLGILAVGSLVLHADQLERSRYTSTSSQLIGLFALTSNGFSVPYVGWKLVSVTGAMIWLITFVVFAVSIANMNFKFNLRALGWERVSLKRRLKYAFPALIGNAGMIIIVILLYQCCHLPLISIGSTAMLAVYTVGLTISSGTRFVVDHIGRQELLALGVWGLLFAAGFLGIRLHS